MQPTYLYELVQSFSKQEQREAQKWLASPYHNQRTDLRALFECLLKKPQPPSKAAVWQALFPDTPYNDQQLRLIQSYLYRSLEDFLLHQELDNRPESTRHLLLDAYRQRGLDRHFTKAYRQQQRALEQTPLQHPEHHLALYWQERALFQYQARRERTREHNLQAMEDALTLAFLSMKLRQACWLLAHEAVYKAEYKVALEPLLIELALKPAYTQQPAVAIYLNCYRMLKAPEESAHFEAFRDWLFRIIGHFPVEELRDLFLLGINYCIRQINRTADSYLREALELYKKGLETDLLLENGVLSRFTYNNIAGIALRLQELDWTAHFLETYRPKLAPHQRQAAYSLNAARLAFSRKDYAQAITHLQQADYRDFINNLVARTLLLKCYFELDEYDLLEYHLQTMRSFLRRKRKMSYHQQNYRNIVQLTFRLLRLKPGDKATARTLKAAIENTTPLTERRWLLRALERTQ